MKARYWALIAVACIVFAVWWPLGGQHWMAIKTGTCPVRGDCNGGPGPWYGFWSGFGSDLGEYVIVGSVLSSAAMAIRHMNCHVKGCPRVGRFSMAGGEYKICGHHHRGFNGEAPSIEHIMEAHEAHKAGTRDYDKAAVGK